jgi:hypothetical protein
MQEESLNKNTKASGLFIVQSVEALKTLAEFTTSDDNRLPVPTIIVKPGFVLGFCFIYGFGKTKEILD